jgi:S-DNA-T family DNA segregation ATPase FtsK/SpoIIIE
MNYTTLIGEVGAYYLRNGLSSDEGEGTARFILDCLTAEQTAAIAQAILRDPTLAAQVEIKLPKQFVEGFGLPSEILTNERATYFRNAPIEKSALLVTNTGDDEEQSLKELIPIGAPQLLEETGFWVNIASRGLPLTDLHRNWWEKALRGLQDLHLLSLDRFSEFVVQTRQQIEREGLPLITALGRALPALQMPRDSTYFEGLNDKQRGHVSRWKQLFNDASKKRACFLSKQTATGTLLSREDLVRAFSNVQGSIPEADHPVVQTFIHAPSGWNASAAQLAKCEWENIKPLFDGLKREKFNLGKATLDFYDEREADLLKNDEKEYLQRLVQRKTTQADETDGLFYESHRNELREDGKLKSVWDRFIFGAPRETEDFLAGLVECMEFLFSQKTSSTNRRLHIRCERRTKRELKDLNVEAGRYFVRRYNGVKTLFGKQVTWETGELFNYFDLVEQWTEAKTLNVSQARGALQLKFVLTLEIDLLTGGSQKYTTQLLWKFNPAAVTSELYSDISRLIKHPLVFSRASREAISSKGQFQSVDLGDVRTFVPAYGKDRGSFVGTYTVKSDIAKTWERQLKTALEEELIDRDTAASLYQAFTHFKTSYSAALNGFVEAGVASDLQTQYIAYGTLLEAVCARAKGDRNRELLLRPLLQIGTVAIEGTRPAAIVAPWHPLRLAAIGRKARLVADLIKQLLTMETVEFGDPRLFFTDLSIALAHPFYPEVVLGWYEQQAELLGMTDVLADYSLHESPLASHTGLDDTNENPSEAATRVFELVKRYIALQPHEQANLSVVLYNCDSARLPQAVVDKIGSTQEDDEDVRCQIVVRHRDPKRLRTLYEKIIESVDTDADSYNASEATQDFMARLRIGIMADQAPVPNEKDGCPNDLAFSQDVIARHSRLEWYPENADPIPVDSLVPAHWSRRRPAAKDDMKSVVYLCCPAQTAQGWSFITALTTFLKGDWDGVVERRFLPARQLDFQEADTARIFEETHNLANWVVNYDELLDRRQLLNHKVRVIRYKQSSTQGRNLIISSNAPLGLLKSMVLNRLKALNLELTESEYLQLTERFIEDANDISGDIVLRAAKRGRHASELLGVVLSRYLIRTELGDQRYFGWYFLDDYASWLGQREEQIADILALCPSTADDGTLRLSIVVSEAKYIDASSLSAKRKESQKQLRDTVQRLRDAIFEAPVRLDRTLWLARLSDLLLDGIQVPANAQLNLSNWRRAIREGTCEILIRGYSHVFISGPSDSTEPGYLARVATLEDAYQETFSRAQVRALIMRYFRKQDPLPIRLENTDENLWAQAAYRQPSDEINNSETGKSIVTKTIENTLVDTDIKIQPEITEDISQTSTTSDGDDNSESEKAIEKVWAFTGIDKLLLARSQRTGSQTEDDQTWLKQIETRMKGALQQFQLQAKLEERVLTPNAALLKFAGSTHLTVDQVLKRRSEFLTTYGLNLISVQPEPGRIALAIERPVRQVIGTSDLWSDWKPIRANGNHDLLIAVREDDGSNLFLSPGKHHAPHTLVAGSTGSGKSVLLQNIILGIAATNTAAEARIILIDPKQGVDYFQFEGLPHLQNGVIDQHEKALEHLSQLVIEMDQRYAKFKTARSANLAIYNQKVAPSERLPVIWLIHDEFAEWMLMDEYKHAVTSLVGRLGVKARAAGIYLIFAAQRPDSNVMPMQLRANLGNRLILRVDSEGTSEIALGEKGAERLLGRGHLIAKLEGSTGIIYAQVPFVEPEFTDQVVDIICGKVDK